MRSFCTLGLCEAFASFFGLDGGLIVRRVLRLRPN